MPSSLIIVALAAAWLVVLVPMVARNRQEVARPADSALSARVVRSGNKRRERHKEGAMSENASNEWDDEHGRDVGEYADTWDEDDAYDDYDGYEDYDDARDDADGYDDGYDDYAADDYAEDNDADDYDEPPRRARSRRDGSPGDGSPRGQYRPGRGGFDPEAAELAARAKYAFRQRVVLGLLAAVVVTIVLATAFTSMLWWANAIVDVSLVGYLVYLRRQVRIENQVRERRMARLNNRTPETSVRGVSELDRHAPESRGDDDADDEQMDEPPRTFAREPRRTPKPAPEAIKHNGVYVDIEDEDPAFYELDEPGEQPFRRAVGQ